MSSKRAGEASAAALMTSYARERIVERLQTAAEIAAQEGAMDVESVRAAVDDVTARLDVLELTRESAGDEARDEDDSAPGAAMTVLASAAGEPVGEFLLVPLGRVQVERPLAGGDFEFTRYQAEQAVRWFDALGRKLAIDYEHQSFDRFNTRTDGLCPAAGWIGGLEVREDGLWATKVEWTDRAATLLRAGEYKYFSPVIFWTDESRAELAGLGPVALTNDPAMLGVSSLAASRDAAARLREARGEIELLRGKLRAQEADTFVERGLRQGKIVEATSMDWRDDFLRDPAAAEARLARSPILIMPGRAIAVTSRGRRDS